MKKDLFASIREHPIAKVVEPLRADAMKHAEEQTRAQAKRVFAELEENGWDAQKAAPHPRSNIGRIEYQRLSQRAHLFRAFVRHIEPSRYYGAPEIVKPDQKKIEERVAFERENASLQYEAFVVKLVQKIGDVTSAKIEGHHVWGHSFLTIFKPTGEMQVWKTQQITNISVLGNLFYQWPSRQLKLRCPSFRRRGKHF